MKPSSANAKTKRTQARNAALLNLLGTPGLGSLMAGCRVVGGFQLALAIAGFVLVAIWFAKTMSHYYGQMFSESTGDSTTPMTNLVVGAGLFVAAWFWSLATSIQLVNAAKKAEITGLKNFGAASVKLPENNLATPLATLPDWTRHGETIMRTFIFSDLSAAMKFTHRVAEHAEAANHHPDVDIRGPKVTLTLTTHDVGGLTEKDFALARTCNLAATME